MRNAVADDSQFRTNLVIGLNKKKHKKNAREKEIANGTIVQKGRC